MKWPSTMQEAQAAGYKVTSQFVECRGCKAAMFWVVTPNGKWQPFTTTKDSRLMPHHAECPARKQFRIANELHASRSRFECGAAKAEQLSMFADPRVAEMPRKEFRERKI